MTKFTDKRVGLTTDASDELPTEVVLTKDTVDLFQRDDAKVGKVALIVMNHSEARRLMMTLDLFFSQLDGENEIAETIH